MKNAMLKLFVSISAFALCAITLLSLSVGYRSVLADTSKTVYCDDGLYRGTGTVTSATYDIVCNDYEVIDGKALSMPPSFGNTDHSMKNTCGPLAGLNISAFFDRWCTELIPDYTPGVMFPSGYEYYMDKRLTQTKQALRNLYDLMETEKYGGATAETFKSGLKAYANNAGYSVSTSSFYSNRVSVNLSRLKTAIIEDKIGVILCERFDYVPRIFIMENSARIVKEHHDAPHIMMVTGYTTYNFYNDGITVATETFLHVSSGFSSGETGFVQLNDSFLAIDEAIIYSIY